MESTTGIWISWLETTLLTATYDPQDHFYSHSILHRYFSRSHLSSSARRPLTNYSTPSNHQRNPHTCTFPSLSRHLIFPSTGCSNLETTRTLEEFLSLEYKSLHPPALHLTASLKATWLALLLCLTSTSSTESTNLQTRRAGFHGSDYQSTLWYPTRTNKGIEDILSSLTWSPARRLRLIYPHDNRVASLRTILLTPNLPTTIATSSCRFFPLHLAHPKDGTYRHLLECTHDGLDHLPIYASIYPLSLAMTTPNYRAYTSSILTSRPRSNLTISMHVNSSSNATSPLSIFFRHLDYDRTILGSSAPSICSSFGENGCSTGLAISIDLPYTLLDISSFFPYLELHPSNLAKSREPYLPGYGFYPETSYTNLPEFWLSSRQTSSTLSMLPIPHIHYLLDVPTTTRIHLTSILSPLLHPTLLRGCTNDRLLLPPFHSILPHFPIYHSFYLTWSSWDEDLLELHLDKLSTLYLLRFGSRSLSRYLFITFHLSLWGLPWIGVWSRHDRSARLWQL